MNNLFRWTISVLLTAVFFGVIYVFAVCFPAVGTFVAIGIAFLFLFAAVTLVIRLVIDDLWQ